MDVHSSNPIEVTFVERAVSIVSITITHIQLHNEVHVHSYHSKKVHFTRLLSKLQVDPPRPEKPIPQFRVTELVCQMVEE